MKKLLGSLMALSLVATSVTSVVSCTKKYTFDSDVWVITDGGTISDNSFNQSAWEGASAYVVSKQDPTHYGPGDKWKSSKWRASYFEAASQTTSDFRMAYVTSKIAGAKTMILPGFNHGNTIGWAANLADNLIYIDGSGQGVHLDMDKNKPVAKNIIGLQYEAESSGFFAGLAAAVYLNANVKEFGTDLKIATYGGMDNPGAVSNYMWGFLVAFDIFNKIIKEDPKYPKLGALKSTVLNLVNTLNPDAKTLQSISKVENVLNPDESWFSQSFEAGHGKDISDSLISKGANVIFPVAGPQTQDTIDRIKYNKSNAKIVGVDTEQSKIYGEYYIITSALKEIATSTQDALKNIYSLACGFDPSSNSWNKPQTDTCWINTDQSSLHHPSWTGIEPTKSIPKTVTELIHNTSGDSTKDTAFDKIVAVLEAVYSVGVGGNKPVAAKFFPGTLANTYQSQNELKDYIWQAIEDKL
ncbi:BMP family ABC transporter substrate-binding protein [Spiroplasma eriocheiris]|uniref:Ribose/galactose ABC transporter substrate-binding protein n=1 Tax=Spiroplasma eriocheiris TaxID=315358 RepID=A0A0H3XLL7_9MOLU|nr:BMP family ABC transporter substrate-binding protein [Spiroplasma eriocheiris]AHF57211.1 ABC-type transport system substrate-binding protein [Spiroplasma eriocheiris CCTCC M 207170]AKM53677.1 ribose/galactose ABC transporter substrate-binding protein [Spiroplasma eriocheiris]